MAKIEFNDEYQDGYNVGREGEALGKFGKFSVRLTAMNAKRVHEFKRGFLDGRKNRQKEEAKK